MNWYSNYITSSNITLDEDDKVQALYKNTPYIGIIVEKDDYEPNNPTFLVAFDEFNNLTTKFNQIPYKLKNDPLARKLEDILHWMESPFHTNQLTLIQKSINWKNQKSDLNLIEQENFTLYGASWDVRQAKRIIHQSPRPTIQFPVNAVASYVNQGLIAIEDKYKDADLSIPIILINSRENNEEIGLFPIDGWHRIKKALKESIPTLPAYPLTYQESKVIRNS